MANSVASENAVQQCESTGPPAADVMPVQLAQSAPQDDDLIESELLVEEVSIDGMCGVY